VIPDYSIYVPNAFTPNGDGTNDYFRIYGKLNSLSYLEIQIFDRWGELVFRSNDLNFAWDGTFRGAMETPAIFIWQLNLTFINGHSEYKKGSLTLIR
jgi:gliding motility-associated-like protein